VIPDGEPGLSAADHHRVHPAVRNTLMHVRLLANASRYAAGNTVRIGRNVQIRPGRGVGISM
jgi:hypothetical protein